jgi:peptide-methionine (R)-S-oxide reductase
MTAKNIGLSSIFILAGLLVFAACGQLGGGSTPVANAAGVSAEPQPTIPKHQAATDEVNNPEFKPTEVFDGVKVTKTEEEWQKILTPAQFAVMRKGGTERAFSGEYDNNHQHGTYYCAACGLALFKSAHKFDSGTGWPSFYKPIAKENVTELVDNLMSEERTEIRCSRCGSHLGHVFDDGPKPTGLRYCMNSVALKFQKSE